MPAMQSLAVAATAVLLVLPALALGCACTREFAPVCGSDTRTYSNPCMLRCARESGSTPAGRSLVEVHAGPCDVQTRALPESACICTRKFEPVCGTDGQTYSNDCVLNCARVSGTSAKGAELSMAHAGPCGFVSEEVETKSAPKFRPCVCTFLYHPVCGTDGRTYPNGCTLDCARRDGTSSKGAALALAHDGHCTELSVEPRVMGICPMIYQPVCGTDGRTYSNKCFFEAAKSSSKGVDLQIAHMGMCGPLSDVAPRGMPLRAPCPQVYAPVCGTDGVTYDNRCELELTREIRGPIARELRLAYPGPCNLTRDLPQLRPIICPLLLAPVCGTDGVTYDNKCLLNAAKTRGTSSKGAELQVAHVGEC